MSYEEMIEFNTKFLDTLDLDSPWSGEEVVEWRTKMEVKYENIELPSELEGCLFNFMDDYDITEYILKRFGGRSQTVEMIYFYGCGRERNE